MIVAVDGPVAAGKGTLARRLADHFGLRYLDTGALYRAVALKLIEAGTAPDDVAAAVAAAAGLEPADLTRRELRDEAVGAAASQVAALAPVRQALLDYQRRVAAMPPGAVLDGRDIGTVVCPQAQAKLFVTASPEVRARRRWLEIRARGTQVEEARVLADLNRRDAQDGARAVAPLRPAPDAYLLDTSDLDIEKAFAAARDFVESRLPR